MKRSRELANLIRLAPLLAVAGTAGFALAACGGGSNSALSTRTAATATRSTATPTLSEPTRTRTVALPTATDATTTETTTTAVTTTTTTAVTTTAPGPTTTRPAIIVTTETQSTTVPVPVVPTTTTEPASASSSSGTPWGWIILGIVLAVALVTGIVVWRRTRAGAARWSAQAADLNQRALRALDDVLAHGSLVTGQVQALASEAQSLEARAPDDRSRAGATQVRTRLDDLAATLESDRNLRLGSPPPSEEQLAYSTALIRRQAEQLEAVLRPPTTGGPPA
jgi:hypothetical protein